MARQPLSLGPPPTPVLAGRAEPGPVGKLTPADRKPPEHSLPTRPTTWNAGTARDFPPESKLSLFMLPPFPLPPVSTAVPTPMELSP